MILVDIDGVTVSRPGRPLLDGVSVTVTRGDRIGVVGINGTGKSTLLGVLAGRVEPESGVVRRGRGVTVAHVAQVADLPAGTVRAAVGEDWRGEAVIDRLGLGSLIDTDVGRLSGGEEKRVQLARALVADADLLVLDEPTNHLDVDAIEWLEKELAGFKGGLVIVTHDRHLLDRVTTKIVELDRGRAHHHDGGYPGYLDGRARREERQAAAESSRRNLARRELAWLRRGAPARTRKSKARIESATALVRGRPSAPARSGGLAFGAVHDATPRLGDQVIELHDVIVGFGGRPPLVEGLDLLLDRRERLGVVGANGSGKSTLLEVLEGRRAPLAGRVVHGPTVRVVLHDQRGRDLDPDRRVRDVVAGDGAEPTWWDAGLLERFWFDDDAQWSPVGLLSGGERRRLQLVLTLAARPNVLLLD
ncbi:MAG: ABC-F family ATP-binding cassette domain-containing protein, partial [Acidimicrobiales bacterium]